MADEAERQARRISARHGQTQGAEAFPELAELMSCMAGKLEDLDPDREGVVVSFVMGRAGMKVKKARSKRIVNALFLGRCLRRWRLQAQLTQEELAERTGVSVATIGVVERERGNIPVEWTLPG